MEHRKRLLARIQGLKNPASPLPIVTLEQFFEANDYHESIVGSTNSTYHPQTLYSIFKRFREIAGIDDVYVEVKAIGHPDKWPVADTFWVIGTDDPREFRHMWPSEFWDNNLPSDYLTFPRKDGRTTESLEIPAGMVATGLQYYNMI